MPLNASRYAACTLLLATSLSAVLAAPVASADLKESLQAAMASEDRPAADRERDANRKPVETLAFFGLTPEMRVLELLPGGGWYTRLLAPALNESGKLYVAVGTQNIEAKLLPEPGFEAVEVVAMKGELSRPEGQPRFDIADLSLDVEDIDLAVTFRNMHNFSEKGRAELNKAVFAALKPGGHYGVVDHTLRHMALDTAESRRRMDPVLAIKEVQAAGFELVDFSDLHHRPDDELRFEVGRKSVTGNSDRFTLLFRKPLK